MSVEKAFECEHVRIMFCDLLTPENRPKMDDVCKTCPYHRPNKALFCFHRKPLMVAGVS